MFNHLQIFTRRTHQQARHLTEQWAGTELIELCYLKYNNTYINNTSAS